MRSDRIFGPLSRAIGAAHRTHFRVVQFSVQVDHIHLIVEADRPNALTAGCHGLVIRCAAAINHAAKRSGTVWSHRYHAHPLATPREVRSAIAYVLLNFRKHLRAAPGLDPRSSAAWFDGWRHPMSPPASPPLVAPARTWLAAVGWRRAGGTLTFDEGPKSTGR